MREEDPLQCFLCAVAQGDADPAGWQDELVATGSGPLDGWGLLLEIGRAHADARFFSCRSPTRIAREESTEITASQL